ncbi:MAG: glycine--tRNA ligase subunit beta [Nitrospiraceae bacterium]
MARKPTARRSAPPRKTAATTELLLEIEREELPYQFVAPASRTRCSNRRKLYALIDHRLSYGTARALGTPRRLALLIDGLATQQASSAVKEAMGPSKAVAFGPDGQPTKAAIGSVTGQGVAVQDLQIRATPKRRICFRCQTGKGSRAVATVLTQLVPALLAKLSFPKAMHWNETDCVSHGRSRWLVVPCAEARSFRSRSPRSKPAIKRTAIAS